MSKDALGCLENEFPLGRGSNRGRENVDSMWEEQFFTGVFRCMGQCLAHGMCTISIC